jgi:hypothetical protein
MSAVTTCHHTRDLSSGGQLCLQDETRLPQQANVSYHIETVSVKDGKNRSNTLTGLSATMVA